MLLILLKLAHLPVQVLLQVFKYCYPAKQGKGPATKKRTPIIVRPVGLFLVRSLLIAAVTDSAHVSVDPL